MLTVLMLGAVLPMVTVFEATASPSSSPSPGVTMQTTSSPLSKLLPSRVVPDSPMSTPLTPQA